MEKTIMGVVGHMASGKGTVAAYFKEKYNAETIRFSSTLREVLNLLDLPHSRENTQKIFLTLEKEFGASILSKVVSKKITDSDKKFVIVEGIRRKADLERLEKIPGFKLVGIKASIKTRYSRLKQRNGNPDDSTKTFEQFEEEYKVETEAHIDQLINQATKIISNEGELEDFHSQLDKLI